MPDSKKRVTLGSAWREARALISQHRKNLGIGLALVLQTPAGRTYLYDTGNGYPAGDGWERDPESVG